MTILSIYGCCGWEPEDAWLHNSGASLWVDAKHICTISEERLTRIKYDGSYPKESINYCLKHGGLKSKDIDKVVYVENIHSLHRKESIKKILWNEFTNSEVVFVGHHVAHASASYYTSGFKESLILTFDGAGNSFPTIIGDVQEIETGFLGIGFQDHRGLRILNHFKNGIQPKNNFPLGQMYNSISRLIYEKIEPEKSSQIENGFVFMESAPGKIMGLSAYGNPSKIKIDEPLFLITKPPEELSIIGNPNFDFRLLDEYEPEDLSAWLQLSFRQSIVVYLRQCKEIYGNISNLVLGGGCALNVLTNTALRKYFSKIHVFPAANDSGLCFGGGIYQSVKEHSYNDLRLPNNLSQLSRPYTVDDILKVVK